MGVHKHYIWQSDAPM